MLGAIAAGSLSGQQAAQEQNDQDQQREQQRQLQLAQLQMQQSSQARQDLATQYDPLFRNMGQLDPASRAGLLGEYGKAAGAIQPPNLSALGGPFAAQQSGVTRQPSPEYFPYGLPQPVQPGAAPAPGVAGAPPLTPAAGEQAGTGAPAAPNTFTSPGGATLTLQGVSDKERQTLGSRIQTLDKQMQNADISPQDREALMARRQALNINPQTPEEYQQALRDLGGLETNIYARGPAIGKENENKAVHLVSTHNKRYAALTGADPKAGKLSPMGAARELVDLLDMENNFQKSGGEEVSGEVIRQLNEYAPDIEKIRAGLAPGASIEDRNNALLDARRIQDEIQGEKLPGQSLKETEAVMKVLGSMSPRDQANPQTRYETLRAAGIPEDVARAAAKPEAKFGGAAGQRTLNELIRSAKDWANATPEMRQFIADEIVGAARATGQKVTLSADDIKNMDPLSLLKLQNAKKELEIKGTTLQKDRLTLTTDQWKYDHLLPAQLEGIKARTHETNLRSNQLQAGKKPGAEKGKLTEGQVLNEYRAQEKEAATAYQRFIDKSSLSLSDTYNPEKIVKDLGTDPKTGKPDWSKLPAGEEGTGAKLWWQWQHGRNITQAAMRGMGVRLDEATGSFSMGGKTSPPANPPTPTAKKTPPTAERDRPRNVTVNGRPMQMTPAQAYEKLQERVRLGQLTPAQANATMTSLFGAR